MILITIKSGSYSFINNNFFCKENIYINSIEFVNNKFDEVLIKIIADHNTIVYRNKFNEFHNLSGPAYERTHKNGIEKEYWINNYYLTKQQFNKIIESY